MPMVLSMAKSRGRSRLYSLFNTAPDQDGLPVLAMTLAAIAVLAQHDKRKGIVEWMVTLGTAAAAVGVAYVCTCTVVGFVWGRAANYPYFFGIGSDVSVPPKPGNPIPSPSTLAKTFAMGIWGGMFWSATIGILVAAVCIIACLVKRKRC